MSLVYKSHQDLGRDLDLFMFSEYSPGSCIFLPHGQRVVNAMYDYIRKEYRERGYDEISTPNIFNSDLWKISGHWTHYKEDMFVFEVDDEDEENQAKNTSIKTGYSLKPMNCPCHAVVFKSRKRSYRELPIRFADFGVLHRNESRGSLRGLTRVRKFVQDDAHIFCRHSQLKEEMIEAIKFMGKVYSDFGLEYQATLSTRPDKFIGNQETWENAENGLKDALDSLGINYTINDKDGAFYGPKIDIILLDSQKRKHQCGTIQLDFQLPERFELSYVNENNEKETPVMIHRAIYGSFERFFSIILESYQGHLPMFISPRQFLIVPLVVEPEIDDYCRKLQRELKNRYYIDYYSDDEHYKEKIKYGHNMNYNYLIIIGKKEVEKQRITVRYMDREKNKPVNLYNITLDELNNLA